MENNERIQLSSIYWIGIWNNVIRLPRMEKYGSNIFGICIWLQWAEESWGKHILVGYHSEIRLRVQSLSLSLRLYFARGLHRDHRHISWRHHDFLHNSNPSWNIYVICWSGSTILVPKTINFISDVLNDSHIDVSGDFINSLIRPGGIIMTLLKSISNIFLFLLILNAHIRVSLSTY